MRCGARIIAWVGLVGCGGGCGPGGDLNPPRASPGLEIRPGTFAEARAGFATRLTRRGPSPSAGEPLATPPGAEAVDYRSGGLRLRAYRSLPSGEGGRRPAVLFLHGGFSFGAGDWAMSRPFRDAGYVVLTPVLRGEDGQPGDFTLFAAEVDDVLAAAEALAGLPDVDPDHVFVAGHSVGGTLALLAAMASPRFRAAASFSGAPDLATYLAVGRTPPPFDPASLPEVRIRSAVAHATSFRCPARLYFGEDEIWVQSGTHRTAILAARAGLDVAAVEVPGDHFSSVPPAIRRALAFFRANLGPVGPPR